MRLIDLDQTVFVPIVDESKGGVEYEMQMTVAEFFARFLEGWKQEVVDAVPVVHGRWITYPECLGYDGAYHDEHIVCSACHSVWNIIDNDADRFDYCPACGAKMDGERRNDDAAD